MSWEKLSSTAYRAKLENHNFSSFSCSGKIVKSSLEQHSKLPMFNLIVNWEKLSLRPTL